MSHDYKFRFKMGVPEEIRRFGTNFAANIFIVCGKRKVVYRTYL